MKYIASSDNAKIKLIRSLRNKKARRENNLFLLEGERLVFSAPPGFLKEVFIDSAKEDEYASRAVEMFGEYTTVKSEVFEKIKETETTQGIAAVAAIPEPRPVSGDIVCVLDAISDPGNLGTIVRSAAAFGITDIIASECADVYSPKAVRASMGGIYHVNVVPVSYAGAREILISRGYRTAVLDMGGADIYGYAPSPLTALVVGNEAHGVSEGFLGNADSVLAVPMPGGTAESLNAAVSASIAFSWLTHKIQTRR